MRINSNSTRTLLRIDASPRTDARSHSRRLTARFEDVWRTHHPAGRVVGRDLSSAGEANPWADADWDASWKRTTVTDEQWRSLRDSLRQHAETWRKVVAARSEWNDMSAAGTLASAAHTAYHLGAIRQILAAMELNTT